MTEILLKVALNSIQTNKQISVVFSLYRHYSIQKYEMISFLAKFLGRKCALMTFVLYQTIIYRHLLHLFKFLALNRNVLHLVVPTVGFGFLFHFQFE